MIPTITDINYFLAIAETLNIRQAAERLRLSQPCLSKAVLRLEKSFGAPLLIRQKKGVQLTRTGQRLIPKARVLIEEWDKLSSEISKDEAEVRGRYVLGCAEAIGLITLPLFLPAVLNAHSTLEVQLVHDFSPQIAEDVANYKIDFGIVAGPVMHPDLVVRRICLDEIRMWVSRDNPNPTQDPRSGKAILLYNPVLLGVYNLSQFGKEVSFERVLTTTSLFLGARLVAAGLGIGIFPEKIAAFSGGLRSLSREIFNISHEICLIYRRDAQQSQASRRLAREIEAELIEKLKPALAKRTPTRAKGGPGLKSTS